MKKLILNLALLAVIVAAFSIQGCKKEEVTPTPTPVVVKTNKELLQGFKWKLTGETTDGKDSFGDYEACEKDNTDTFKADGSLVTDEGATKCDASDPQTKTLTYTLSTDEKTITIKDSGFSLDFKIVEISATTLKLQFSFGSTIVSTYTRQ